MGDFDTNNNYTLDEWEINQIINDTAHNHSKIEQTIRVFLGEIRDQSRSNSREKNLMFGFLQKYQDNTERIANQLEIDSGRIKTELMQVPEHVKNQLINNTVKITLDDGSWGTAFPINIQHNGRTLPMYISTKHVFLDPQGSHPPKTGEINRVRIPHQRKLKYIGEPNNNRDIAIVPMKPNTHQVLQISKRIPHQGEVLYTGGFSQGHFGLSAGIILSHQQVQKHISRERFHNADHDLDGAPDVKEGNGFIYMRIHNTHGDSGAPVLDKEGITIGIVVGGWNFPKFNDGSRIVKVIPFADFYHLL